MIKFITFSNGLSEELYDIGYFLVMCLFLFRCWVVSRMYILR